MRHKFRIEMQSIAASRERNILNVMALSNECVTRALGMDVKDIPTVSREDCESYVIIHEEISRFKLS